MIFYRQGKFRNCFYDKHERLSTWYLLARHCFSHPRRFCLHNKNENLLPSPESWCRCRKTHPSEAEPEGLARPWLNCTVAMAFFRLWNLLFNVSILCWSLSGFLWNLTGYHFQNFFWLVWLSVAKESETIRKECPHETLKNFSFTPRLHWKSGFYGEWISNNFSHCSAWSKLHNILRDS